MICYRDITYCDTSINRCENKKCKRHLDTEDEYFSLTKNTSELPVSINDFSKDCEVFNK